MVLARNCQWHTQLLGAQLSTAWTTENASAHILPGENFMDKMDKRKRGIASAHLVVSDSSGNSDNQAGE